MHAPTAALCSSLDHAETACAHRSVATNGTVRPAGAWAPLQQCYIHDCDLSYQDRYALKYAYAPNAILPATCDFWPDCTRKYVYGGALEHFGACSAECWADHPNLATKPMRTRNVTCLATDLTGSSTSAPYEVSLQQCEADGLGPAPASMEYCVDSLAPCEKSTCEVRCQHAVSVRADPGVHGTLQIAVNVIRALLLRLLSCVGEALAQRGSKPLAGTGRMDSSFTIMHTAILMLIAMFHHRPQTSCVQISDWSRCSNACGAGEQIRTVGCNGDDCAHCARQPVKQPCYEDCSDCGHNDGHGPCFWGDCIDDAKFEDGQCRCYAGWDGALPLCNL